MSSKLVLYYSYSNGNTKAIAERIAKAVGADLARIEPATPYAGTHKQVVEQGREEVDRGFRPALKPLEVELERYDEIILGTPTWWYTMAPAILTFLTDTDLSGKKVALFHTHGGWPGHTLKDMAALCQGAEVVSTFSIQFDSTGGPERVTGEDAIDAWIKSLL